MQAAVGRADTRDGGIDLLKSLGAPGGCMQTVAVPNHLLECGARRSKIRLRRPEIEPSNARKSDNR
jgi:hypothetical protein